MNSILVNYNNRRAKLIPLPDQATFISHVMTKRWGTRNAALALLSFKAALRACEIAGLAWPAVLDSGGRVSNTIEIHHSIAKGRRGRRIPCHPELRRALRRLHAEQGKPLTGPVCRSERGAHLTAKAVVNFFSLNYREIGLYGCSSHSGRRTFITLAARSLAKAGGSLRDVQLMAGHADLGTTQAYIDGDSEAQHRLVRML